MSGDAATEAIVCQAMRELSHLLDIVSFLADDPEAMEGFVRSAKYREAHKTDIP